MSQRTDVLMRAGMLSLLLSLVPALVSGCGRGGSAGTDSLTPAARQASLRVTAQPPPAMPARRISALLDFDTPDDLTFIASDPAGAATGDARVARSGRQSLLVPPGTSDVVVKLASLLSGRPFPADWTLAGAFVHCDRPTAITMSYEVRGRAIVTRSVQVGAGAWTPVMIDLAALAGSDDAEVGALRLTFDPRGGATVRVDDVTLVDNHEPVVDTTAATAAGAAAADGWRVRRRGLYYVVEAPGRFSFALATAHAEQGGWSVADACPSRVRFASANAPGTLTIYPDGRMYWGGDFRAVAPTLADAAEQARQHASPAELAVPETMGRVNRSAAGDAANDGYDESRGAYQVVAAGSRVELTITPRTSTLSRPVLEITGLPPGNALVNMEGRLIAGAVRLANGDLLIELPARIERPTQVNVRVQ